MDLLLHRAASDGRLAFGFVPERVSGISQLVQEVVVELLSDYDPVLDRGANLLRGLSDVGEDDQGAALQAIEEALRAARSHLFAHQQGNAALRPDERLRSLTLRRAVPQGLTWLIELDLTNVRGETTAFALPETSDV